jgi:hypothetical protein
MCLAHVPLHAGVGFGLLTLSDSAGHNRWLILASNSAESARSNSRALIKAGLQGA